jgi:hypothetical protein
MTFSNILGILLLSFQLCSTASAQVSDTVLVRGKRFKPILTKVELPYLVSKTSYDGEYFKIVNGKSDEAILFSEADADIKLRAANTYYHLNLIRDFWANTMKSEHVKSLPKIIVRLNITNVFSDLGHYMADHIDAQYNNALSIPAGETMDGEDSNGEPIKKEYWGNEIWFRPVKKIRTEDLPNSGLDATGNPLTKYISMLSDPIRSSSTSRLIQLTLQKIFAPEQLRTPYQTSVLRQAGTIAVTALLLEASKHSDKLFLEKYYYLDTAMIPEIIYHEFSHIALSDHLALSLSTPMLEGMADYFAVSFNDNPNIASKIKKYSLSMPKNGKNKNTYSPIYETNMFANSDFVLSVLWKVRLEFPEIADQLIFNARTMLKTGFSDIRHDLIGALLESCNTTCLSPRADRMKLRDIFESKGF